MISYHGNIINPTSFSHMLNTGSKYRFSIAHPTYDNLDHALDECGFWHDCNGVTQNKDGTATLRRGSSFRTSPSGETSFMKGLVSGDKSCNEDISK